MQSSRRGAALLWAGGLAGCFGSSSPAPPPPISVDGSTPDAASDGPTEAAAEASTTADAAADAPTAPDAGCRDDGGAGTFACTGSMGTARIAPGAAVLSNGDVLVAGGWNATSQTLTSAEVYDPSSGTFSPTGSMASGHLWAGWTAPWPLVDGSVLVGGGLAASGALLGSAELYDPTTGTFAATGSLPTPVIAFDLVSLEDGSVLFIGGYSAVTGAPPTPGWQYTAGTSAVQLYDATTNMFQSGGTLAEARLFGCNVVLASGDVVALGGTVGTSATFEPNIEELDPSTGQWSTVGELADGVTCGNAAFVLPSGAILLDGANAIDPSTWTSTPISNPLTTTSPMLVQLANGDVLAVGGKDASGNAIADAQRFDATTSQWSPVGSLHQPRNAGRALLLQSGDVLVVGGSDATGAALATAEIFSP
jgi:hypothetical protein